MNIKRTIKFETRPRKLDNIVIDKNVALRIRIQYNACRIEILLGFRVDADKWDCIHEKVKAGTINKMKQTANEINRCISDYRNTVNEIFARFELIEKRVPSQAELTALINEAVGKVRKDKNGLIGLYLAYDEFVREISVKDDWTHASFEKYGSAKNHMLKFDKNLSFDSLTGKRLNQYLLFLRDKENLVNTTIKNQINYLQKFLKWSTKKKYNANLAFIEFEPKLITVPKKVIFLDWSELMHLNTLIIPNNKKYLERVRDVFCLCSFTSLRYSDIHNLKWSEITDKTIEVVTIKTHDKLIINLNKYATGIIEKYKGFEYAENKALPVITNQKMNKYIKELCEFAGFVTPITMVNYKGNDRIETTLPKFKLMSTHAARRSFVCNSLALGIPADTVMKWTGHSDYDSMKPYIDVADNMKVEQMNKWNEK